MRKTKWFLAFVGIALMMSSTCYAEEWAKIYHQGSNYQYYTQSMQKTSDGGYIVVGFCEQIGSGPNWNYWVSKLDSAGTVSWHKIYGGSGSDDAYSVQETFDTQGNPDGYIVAGHTDSFGAGMYDSWLLKLHPDGTIAWQKTYGGSDWDEACSVQQTFDQQGIPDGYVVAYSLRGVSV